MICIRQGLFFRLTSYNSCKLRYVVETRGSSLILSSNGTCSSFPLDMHYASRGYSSGLGGCGGLWGGGGGGQVTFVLINLNCQSQIVGGENEVSSM